ncbi:hypothetical protein Hbl1158_15160 (plasmid) [Halobaculum sp. CBA1158]|uniref:hypothetical protein n=1 Tax=Halobaculum sp. CBA1158 TaxID=2904243 RepID=UPI001F42F872|nr:hypothetical protein [Halobaculum sp. CBA1158]UIP01474.1 hypothetical protein Hbl1158_15160 [Halobaculum sp. CBA1158]
MVLNDDLEERPEAADELRARAADAPRSEDIDVTDVFDDRFVAEHTDFDTFDDLVAASPSDAESAAELELVPDGTWDEFVAEHTVFDDEEELVLEARDHWVATQLDIEA